MDTIVITLNKGMYYISEPNKFEPSAKLIFDNSLFMGSRGYIPAKQNPTKKDLLNGIYKPRLTLTNRFNSTGNKEATLKIELSLPKLLFGNNFDELSTDDFSQTVLVLKSRLKDMGVEVWKSTLENAPVSAIHYSKNIPLTDGTTPHYIISKIKQANIKLSLDVNQTDFRNEGYSFKWHANSYEVAFYDKIKDLETAKNSEKRSLEKDSVLQLHLFDTFKKRNHLEVLRMEVRLNKRQKIIQLFRSIGIDSEIKFQNLFDPNISQKVLLHYLDELESKRFSLFDYKPSSPSELLTSIRINNPKLGLKKIVQLYGLKQIFDSVSPRELRPMFEKHSQRSWYRLISEAKGINLPVVKSPFLIIRKNLVDFIPLKLVDYPC